MLGEKPTHNGDLMDIPASALDVDGAKPAEGDEVEFTVRGTVKKSEDGRLAVSPSAINDQPYSAGDKAPERPEDMSDDDVASAAARADEEEHHLV